MLKQKVLKMEIDTFLPLVFPRGVIIILLKTELATLLLSEAKATESVNKKNKKIQVKD